MTCEPARRSPIIPVMRFLLASASPRRRELLRNAGFDFDVQPSQIVEEIQPGEPPEEFARRAAREKAVQVAASCPAGSFVLGADTVVVIDGEALGKPSDRQDATRMLRLLSGRTHQVHTGICRSGHRAKLKLSSTRQPS